MTHRVVVLDTGVYRRFNKESFEAFLELERKRRITPYADLWVIMELLAHLADPGDEAFRSCRHALTRIYRRCIEPSPGKRGGILRNSEDQVALAITGSGLPDYNEITQRLCRLCVMVATTPSNDPLPFGSDELRWLAENVERTEVWYRDMSMLSRDHAAGVLSQVPTDDLRREVRAKSMRELRNSGRLQNGITESLIREVFEGVGKKTPDPLSRTFVAAVRRKFAAGIEFHTQCVLKVLFDDLNLDASKNRNLIWDQRISFCIGQKMDNSPIWFVTTDPAFARAAEAVGLDARVRMFDNYLEWLNEKRHGLRRPRRSAA